jgi:hemerythrin-like domain-containing protein
MEIYKLLKQDHDEVKELLEQLEQTTERAAKKRTQLFEKVKTMLTAHAEAEEQALYSALRESSESRDVALEAHVEHDVARFFLEELASTPVNDEIWSAKLTVFKELLEHHIEEEEGEMFKEARKLFDKQQAEEMGAEFEELKGQILERAAPARSRR